MAREEKGATRYRAMFRHYPDALTPAQVQEMLGIGRRMTYGLLRIIAHRESPPISDTQWSSCWASTHPSARRSRPDNCTRPRGLASDHSRK